MLKKVKIAAIIVVLCLLVLLPACGSNRLQNYYSQRSNYIEASGTVSYLSYNEEKTALYIEFAGLSPSFDDSCFKIVGENLTAVQERGIDQLVQGDQVTFISAPRYFGDGYVFPIVSMSLAGEEILGFEEGLDNFLKWLETE